MSDIDTSEYRQKLEEERARLTAAAESLGHEGSGSLSDETGELATGGENHLGDTASATYDRELDEGLEEGVQQTIEDIDAALKRIEEGSYGVCEICGEPIGAERLSAIPWTRLCIDDARKQAG